MIANLCAKLIYVDCVNRKTFEFSEKNIITQKFSIKKK